MTTEITVTDLRPMRKEDRKAAFDCGEPSINDYFAKFAWANHNSLWFNKTYVLTVDNVVAAYVTTAVQTLQLTDDVRRSAHLPNQPAPALLIAMLGVDLRFKGRGFSRWLMAHSYRRAIEMRDTFGCVAVTIDPLNERNAAHYVEEGFAVLASVTPPRTPPTMWIPMKRLVEMAAAAND